MGSSAGKLALERGKEIKDELIGRINGARLQYEAQISRIDMVRKGAIVMASASEITEMLDNRETTSEEVMLTFIERTATIGVANNYVIDEMFHEALRVAVECDLARKNAPEKRCWRFGQNRQQCFPPFFGVPISIKECILMKGRTTYLGHVYPTNAIPTENPIFVNLVLKMGFIPFVRSNVPPACKTIETNNNIFGYCKNSWDTTRSCGGSSGGQGGLVGAHCSPIGIGTDIGGSSRIPAQFNGLCTLKPGYRYPNTSSTYYGKYSSGLMFRSEATPLSHSVDDLILFNQFMYEKENYEDIPMRMRDPYLKLLPFDHSPFREKPIYRIGYFTHLEKVNCSRAHERAVMEVVRLLREEGHQVFQISLPNLQAFFFLLLRCWISDSTLDVFNELRKTEPYIKEYQFAFAFAKIPWLIKSVIAWLIRKTQPRFSELIHVTKPMNAKELFHSIYDIQVNLGRQIHEEITRQNVDVLISPGYAFPAPKLGTIAKLTYLFSYTPPWNVLNYPAGSVPITLVREQEQTFSDRFEDSFTKRLRQDVKTAKGIPVGVQVIALPNSDEKVLYVMKQIESKIRFRQTHQSPAVGL